MIPESFVALLAFLGLVAPGVVYRRVLERRRPSQQETTFREASQIALTSLVFTLLAIIILLLLQPLTVRGLPLLPDPSAWLRGGTTYAADNLRLVVTGLVAEVGLASVLAAVAGLVVPSTGTADRPPARPLVQYGAWWRTLWVERPPGTLCWLRVQLDDQSVWTGYLRSFTEKDNDPVRELVLGGSSLRYRHKDKKDDELVGETWDSVVINGDDVQSICVAYRCLADPNELRGRIDDEHEAGAPKPTRGRPLKF